MVFCGIDYTRTMIIKDANDYFRRNLSQYCDGVIPVCIRNILLKCWG